MAMGDSGAGTGEDAELDSDYNTACDLQVFAISKTYSGAAEVLERSAPAAANHVAGDCRRLRAVGPIKPPP
jgi:hypothetical protein